MIIEVAIASTAAVIIASLSFARWVLKQQAQADADTDPVAERRRILERQRAEWIKAANGCSQHKHSDRNRYLVEAGKINEQLIKLTEKRS